MQRLAGDRRQRPLRAGARRRGLHQQRRLPQRRHHRPPIERHGVDGAPEHPADRVGQRGRPIPVPVDDRHPGCPGLREGERGGPGRAPGADDHRALPPHGHPAVVSKGEYAVPNGLVFSYPCRGDGKGNFAIVPGLKLDAFGQQKFQATLQELQEERDAVKELLP